MRTEAFVGLPELWRLDLGDARVASAGLEAQTLLWLDEADRRALERRLTPRGRRTFSFGRWLMRRALATRLNCTPQQLGFVVQQSGKPLCAAAAEAGLCFNLSHAGNTLVLGLGAGHSLGVDIEQVARREKAHRVGLRFFSTKERDLIRGMEADAAAALCLRLWTLRESIVKAENATIWEGLGQFSFDVAGAGIAPGSDLADSLGEGWMMVQGQLDSENELAISLIGSTAIIPADIPVVDSITGQLVGSFLPTSSWAST